VSFIQLNRYKISMGKHFGKCPLGRQRKSCKDNIKTELRKIGYDDVNWIEPAWCWRC
jgi:hypothetical protein